MSEYQDEAAILAEMERRFFAFQTQMKEPDKILQMPAAVLA